MMKTLFVLVDEWNEQDSYSAQVVGVTDKKEWAHAYGEIDAFRTSPEANTIEITTLNMLDGKLLARIEEWLDHERNPLCTCGHRKLHHRGKKGVLGVGGCKHNVSYGGKKSDRYHQCKGFQMAAAQPLIRFEQPKSKIVTAEGLATGWKRYKELFGVEPHGTVKQMAGLLELAKDEFWERLQKEAEARRQNGGLEPEVQVES